MKLIKWIYNNNIRNVIFLKRLDRQSQSDRERLLRNDYYDYSFVLFYGHSFVVVVLCCVFH